MVNIKNINNTKVSHLFVAFCPSLQSLSSLSSFSSEQKSIKNLRPHFLTFFMKQALKKTSKLFAKHKIYRYFCDITWIACCSDSRSVKFECRYSAKRCY